MAALEVLPYAKSVLCGVRDSLFGIISFFKPIFEKGQLEVVAEKESQEEPAREKLKITRGAKSSRKRQTQRQR